MTYVNVTWGIPEELRDKLVSIAKKSKKSENEIVIGLIEKAIEEFELDEWIES